MLVALAILASIGCSCYIFLIWNFGYWRRRGFQEVIAYPLAGSLPSQLNRKRHVAYDIDEIYRQHRNADKVVGIYNGRTPQLLILDAEHVKRILINDFKYFHDNQMSLLIDKSKDRIMGMNPFILTGDEWKERRAEITPGLTISRISASYAITQAVCKAFSQYIAEQMKLATADGLNAKELSLRFTTEVVSDCVLGIDAKSFTAENSTPIYHMIKNVFDQSFKFQIYTAVANLVPQIRHFYKAPFFNPKAVEFFHELMGTAMDLRRQSHASRDRNDFLNYMLQLQLKKNISNELLTGHVMTFLTDGFETTSLVLTHVLLMLARHVNAQQKLRQEIGTKVLSFEELHALCYLDACINESIRLFPPQLIARKVCTQPYEFIQRNGTTARLDPGIVVLLPMYSLHHDENYFAEPEAFQPERFLDNGLRKFKETGCFYGFGEGPRICMGMRFALTQIKAAVVEIVRNFNINVNGRTRKDNQLDDTFFLGSLKGGVWLEFEQIN